MVPQHSTVHQDDLTPLDEHGGFAMKFDMKIVEDVTAEVENVMHLGAVGQFKESREAAAATMERYLDSFPVLIEFLRLLYDQGDHGALGKYVRAAMSNSSAKWDSEQTLLLSLYRDIAFLHTHGYSQHAFNHIQSRDKVVQGLSSTSLEEMNEEQVLAVGLMLRLKYLEHMHRGAVPATSFELWRTEEPTRSEDAPYASIRYLLQQENFWAATNALDVCFRQADRKHYKIDFTKIWDSIGDFVEKTCASDPEEVLWATTDLLQTFCEGLLRRSATQNRHWASASALLLKMPVLVDQKCDSKHAWSKSRSFRRQELIRLDMQVFGNNQSEDAEVNEATVVSLGLLKDHATTHQDDRLLSGILWRIDVLIKGLDATIISTPNGIVPYRIYHKRQQIIILQANKPKKTGWLDFWSRICEEYDFDRNASSVSSGKRPSRDLGSQPKKPTKRVILLGHTGVGKSTLFRTITGKYAPTSDAPVPCTVGIQRDSCEWRDTTLECIDTPGFGDGREDMSNDRVLSEIAEFLKKEYVAGRRLHTVFYLIDVSRYRIDDSAKRQAKVFEALMGDEVWSNVCFIFTHGVSKQDVGPATEHNKDKQRKFKSHLQKGILRSAKEGGAMFCDLGLDFTNYAARGPEKTHSSNIETSAKESQSLADAEDTDDDLLDLPDDSSDDNDDMSENIDDNDEDLVLDVSRDEYRPVDIERVDIILQKMLSRTGPVVLQCQREMVDKNQPFWNTQAALLYENETRDGLEATRAQEARLSEERRAAEATRLKLERLQEELRAAEEDRKREQQEKEAEAEREKLRQAEQTKRAEEAAAHATKEIEQLKMKQKTQEEQEQKAAADAAEAEKNELRSKLKREEEARLDAEWREAEMEASKRFKKKLERLRQEEEAAKSAAEDLRAKEKKAREAGERFKKEIQIIEASAGWKPRIIVHNDTQVTINVRARHTNMPVSGAVANYENNIGAGKLRALHCVPSTYELEVFMSTPTNEFTTLGQIGVAIAYGAGGVAIGVISGALGALGPVGIAASAGLGSALLALLEHLKNTYAEAIDEDYRETGFRSKLQDDEDDSILIASRPGDRLSGDVELQMLIMEATRKGSSFYVAKSVGFGLLKTTRLTISGGPAAEKMDRKGTKYTFMRDTMPIHVNRVASFEDDQRSG